MLLAQIGTAAAEMGQQHKSAQNREQISAKRSRLPEGYRTEQTLIALLATEKLPEGMVKAEDFSDDTLRRIAERLLSGTPPAEVLSVAETDAERQAAGEAFSMLSDYERENAAVIAGDCLRNLQIQHVQQEINAMTELMRTAETPEKRSEALNEVMALSKELARLKQQGR